MSPRQPEGVPACAGRRRSSRLRHALALALFFGHCAGAAAQADDAELLRQTRAASERSDYATALDGYRQLLLRRGGDVDLLIEAARINGYADRNAEAARLYRLALAAVPARRADIVPALSWQSLWSGSATEAASLFAERARAAGPDRVDALDGLGQARQALGDQAGALAAFREAHALAPDQLRLHRRLAMSLLWNGFEDESIEALSRLARRAPDDRDLAWALANARNFSGLHRAALADFLRWPPPVHPGERADLARAWRWAGYEDRAWPLLAGPTDAESVWLRDWRVRRELASFGYGTVERADDRDGLVARAVVVGAGSHPRPGGTVEVQVRRVDLEADAGRVQGTQFQASYRWRLGEPGNSWGTLWPTLALRASQFPGWNPLTPTARLMWVPQDRWRVDAEATRELVETPRAVSSRASVGVWSASVEHRPDSKWLLAGGTAVLRFDDGNTRVRVGGRAERTLVARPRVVAGVEASAFERVEGSSATDRGYWNPRRHAEVRAYAGLTHEARPFDLQLRLGLGQSREVDDRGNAGSGRPHLWELGLGWDAASSLRLRLAMGGTGQGLGINSGGAGYWRRYANLSVNAWF